MENRSMVICRSLLLLLALSVPARLAAQPRPPVVVVLPFTQAGMRGPVQDDLAALGAALQQILIAELALNPASRVADRSAIRKLLEGQGPGASGRIDGETAARIGKAAGARYVITGGFNELDGRFYLDARSVDAETAEVIRAQRVTDRRERLYRVVVEMAQRLTRDMNLPALDAQVRVARQTRSVTIPRDAVILYSQAQYFQDHGQVERAKELYRRITRDFPAMTEAQEALRRIEASGA
jgi:TolB-like protein